MKTIKPAPMIVTILVIAVGLLAGVLGTGYALWRAYLAWLG